MKTLLILLLAVLAGCASTETYPIPIPDWSEAPYGGFDDCEGR